MALVLQSRSRQSGFSLITASVILTVAALVFVSVLPGQEAGDYNQKIIANNTKLEKVDEAMRSFMAANGRRPCPADGRYAVNTPNFGKEAATPGTCTGGTPSAPFGPDASGNLVGGTIPTETLGLPDDYAFDAFGHRFTYIVDKRATVNGNCLTLTTGGIAIKNSVGGPTLDNSMYAYISHGTSGFGAWPLQGGTNRINSGSTDAGMVNNGGFSPGWLTSSYLVQGSKTATFDNMAWYRPDLKNTCALGTLNSVNNCTLTGGQGGGTLANGNTATEYANNTGSPCVAETMTCTAGTLSCSTGNMTTDCKYNSCVPTPPNCPTASPSGPLAATFTPSPLLNGVAHDVQAYADYNIATDLTCTASTLDCNAGTLTCGGSATLTNCQYSSCLKACTPPWGGGGVASGGTVTAFQTASVAYPGSCSSQTRTCTNGAWDGSYTNQSCTVTGGPCTGTGALAWVGTINNGQSVIAYQSASVASPGSCSGADLTCTNGTLGGTSNTFQSCAVTGGGGMVMWVADTFNSRVEKLNSSGTWLLTVPASGCAGTYPSPACANSAANGKFYNPQGISIDSSGNAWVADTYNNRVEEFNSSGTWQQTIPSSCSGGSVPACANSNASGQFTVACGIAVDSSNYVWVLDCGNNRVEEFNGSNGSYLGTFGSTGSSNGQLNLYDGSQGITIDSSNNIWVADTYNNRVEKFNSSGTWLQTIPSSGCVGTYPSPACSSNMSANGQFNLPYGVGIDSSGNVWVADTYNNRVQKFNSSGTWLQTIPSSGCAGTYPTPACPASSSNGQFSNPHNVSLDSSGNLWVTDYANSRVQEFNNSGTYLSSFGTLGTNNGQFWYPMSIAISGGIASCNLPWGGTLASGGSVGAYGTGSVTPPATCPAANSLSCNNGTLSCSDGNIADCQYQSCASTCALPWGGTIASGNSATAYLASSVIYPATCSSQSRTCANGTLSGSYTNQSCSETGQSCTLTNAQNGGTPGGTLSDAGTRSEYTNANANAPAACTSHTMTCNNSVLSCSTGSMTDCQNSSCTQICTESTNQGGGTLNANAPGNTATPEYPSAIVLNPGTCPAANTLTCSAGGLSCSDANINDCQYNSCTTAFDGKIAGIVASSNTGYSVAVGDINGDGYADLIIGAEEANPNGISNAGAVYVLLGSATGLPTSLSSLNGTNGFELDGATANGLLGYSVAVGDVNGDGYADIIIGAPTANGSAGYTYVVFGNASGGVVKKKDGTAWSAAQTLAIGTGNLINGTNGVRFDGQTANDELGWSAATGDFNGDGKADLIIGAAHASYGASFSGSTYLVYGASPLLPVTTANTTNGSTCATVGSTTGLIVGQNVSSANIPAGTTISTVGGGGACPAPHITLSQAATATASGTALSVASVIVNTTYINATNGLRFDGPTANYYSGWSLAAGDIDHVVNGSNNVDDIVIGVPDAGVGSAGYTYVVYGAADVAGVHKNKSGTTWSSTNLLSTVSNGTNGITLTGASASNQAGRSVAVGDVTGDGYADILIGAQEAHGIAGYSYVVFGGPDVAGVPKMKNGTAWSASNSLAPSNATTGVINGTNGVRFDGVTASDESGYVVTAADFNGDGIEDIVIGAMHASYGASASGSTYVVFGASPLLPTTTVTTTNGKPCATVASVTGLIVGQTVSSVNIPAATTITAIGSACGSGTCNGASCVTLSGNATATAAGSAMQIASVILNTTFINATNGFRLDDNTASEQSGWSIAAGDFNGAKNGSNNLNDIAIGAPYYSSATGAVYLINGQTSGLSSTNTLQ